MTAIAAAPAAGGDYPPVTAIDVDRATGASTADAPSRSGPSPARTARPAVAADRSRVTSPAARTGRSWPLLALAAPAAAEVWSGWVGIAQKTGFGLVSPLPGIWPSLHLDTSITLPVGVEAYAAYALRAWLTSEPCVSGRTRRFAKWSAICSFGLGMGGQVAYHLLAQAGAARAPWAITTIVSCLPVLVLAMGTTLAHMLRAAIGRAKADGSVARTVARICRSDLIVVDDIGMLPAGQDAAEAFYRITDAAYERRSVAVTSNIHPSGFDSIMPKTLATATVDRLLHHAHLVLTKGDSHRLAEALTGKGVIQLAT